MFLLEYSYEVETLYMSFDKSFYEGSVRPRLGHVVTLFINTAGFIQKETIGKSKSTSKNLPYTEEEIKSHDDVSHE